MAKNGTSLFLERLQQIEVGKSVWFIGGIIVFLIGVCVLSGSIYPDVLCTVFFHRGILREQLHRRYPGRWAKLSQECTLGQKLRSSPSKYRRIVVGSESLIVEVADSPEEITKGLGYRDTIGSDGMLFVLPQRTVPSFWMMGMRFNLDFIWIDANRVVDITPNVPSPTSLQDLPLYSPAAAVTHVLEMHAGETAKRGIRIGDRVDLFTGEGSP